MNQGIAKTKHTTYLFTSTFGCGRHKQCRLWEYIRHRRARVIQFFEVLVEEDTMENAWAFWLLVHPILCLEKEHIDNSRQFIIETHLSSSLL